MAWGLFPGFAALLVSSAYEVTLGSWLDAALAYCFAIWRCRDYLATVTEDYVDEDIFSLAWKVVFALAVAIAWFRFRLRLVLEIPVKDKPWTGPGKPVLMPARVTHRRLFPEKHTFAYPHLVVGVPVGWEGNAGGMVSTNGSADSHDDKSWFPTRPVPSKAWFHIDGADHLHRGPGSLKAKLHEYLKSEVSIHLISTNRRLLANARPNFQFQGVDPATYLHGYLVTAPSFMGYSHNPAAYWYLYSETKELAAMILEVNNTFGERRIYFLPSDDRPVSPPPAEHKPQDKFTASWTKDFHLSIFNSRKGSYSLQAHDVLPLGPNGDTTAGRLDATMTLRSSKGHPKIVARFSGEGDPVDPAALGALDKVSFLLRWWWVPFATIPRIVKESVTLALRKNMHYWHRPEPLSTAICRPADATERQLEPVFRAYLQHLVERSREDLTVTYVRAGGDEEQVVIKTPTASRAAGSIEPSHEWGRDKASTNGDDNDDDPGGKEDTRSEQATEGKGRPDPNDPNHVVFRVLTPSFYTRFVHYAHDFEAIFSELRDSRTVHVSRPELLPRIFVSETPPPAKPLALDSPLDFACFSIIRALRRAPEKIVRPLTSAQSSSAANSRGGRADAGTPTHTVEDVRGFRLSGMDGFVLSGAGGEQTKTGYRGLVPRLFLAELALSGSLRLLWGVELALRAGIAWTFAAGLDELVTWFVHKGHGVP